MSLIVILAPVFSGGQALAERLHERFGFRLVDENVLIERAAAWGLSQSKLREALHEPAFSLWLHSRFRRIARSLVVAALMKEIDGGNAVYCGNAGYLLAGSTLSALRIRLIAPTYSRIDEACRRLMVTRKQAAALVRRLDKRQERWIREVCGRRDEFRFDISFDLKKMGLDAVASDVGACTEKWSAAQFGIACQESEQWMVLANRARAAFALDAATAAFRPVRPWTGFPARRPQFVTFAAALIALGVSCWSPSERIRTFAGVVTDTQCAGKHPTLTAAGLGECVRRCVLTGDHVRYAVQDGNQLHILSDQRAGESFAGRQVKVRGVVDRNTNVLHVRSIRPIS